LYFIKSLLDPSPGFAWELNLEAYEQKKKKKKKTKSARGGEPRAPVGE